MVIEARGPRRQPGQLTSTTLRPTAFGSCLLAATVLALAVLPATALSASALSSNAETTPCSNESWNWIGADVFHCPGGTCVFDAADSGDSLRFRFSAEPWIRAIDPEGPAMNVLIEGDVLVAINGLLITTASGGRELGGLEKGRDARITIRRGDRLLDVEIRPEPRCGGPLMLVGSSRLELPNARQREFTVSARAVGDGTLIDFTTPHRVGETALDLSLGMTVRCTDCVMRRDEQRWIIRAYPTVESLNGDGVAHEAGLRVGDSIVEISGHDLLTRAGGELMFSPPRGDFKIRYTRGDQEQMAPINRRIIDQRIRVTSHRSERVKVQIRPGKDGWSPGVLGALTQWWSDLRRQSRGDTDASLSIPGMDQRWIASGDAWGLASLGLLFEAKDGRFFVPRGQGETVQMRLLTEPVVADVIEGGAGESAGLEVGDVILRVDGHPVLGSNGSYRMLFPQPNKRIQFHFSRDGKTKRTTLLPKETP